MDDRDRLGGLTGATGRLTPDDPDGEFVPAETREISDAETARDLTAAAHRRRGERVDEATDDPAYRLEEHLPPEKPGTGGRGGETRIGGDEVRSPEDEHF